MVAALFVLVAAPLVIIMEDEADNAVMLLFKIEISLGITFYRTKS